MSHKTDLWEYAIAYFQLPALRLQAVSEVLGTANIDAISASAQDKVTDAENELEKVQRRIKKLEEESRASKLLVEQVQVDGAGDEFIKKHMGELIDLLATLREASTAEKFVLPQFRGVTHFEVGDEIMIFVGEATDDRCSVEHDWISAKMLCPGWDWVMHCHSNVPWTNGGGNGGHYFRTTDQDVLFKRSDFFGLRNMFKEGSDTAFLDLLPNDVAKRIRNGTVDPLTNDELEQQQESFIRRATEVVDFYAQNVPIIAERYGIAA